MAGSSGPSFICTHMTRSPVRARIWSVSLAPRVWCQMSTQQPAFGRSVASNSSFASAAVRMLVKGRNSTPTSRPWAAARSQSAAKAGAASASVPS